MRRSGRSSGYLTEAELEREVERLRRRGLGWLVLLPVALAIVAVVVVPILVYKGHRKAHLEDRARATADRWVQVAFARHDCTPGRPSGWCSVERQLDRSHVTLARPLAARDCTHAYLLVELGTDSVPGDTTVPECASYTLRRGSRPAPARLYVILAPAGANGTIGGAPPFWSVAAVSLALPSLPQV